MFSQLRSVESWSDFGRRVLVALAVLMLAPGAILGILGLAFFLAPVAFVVIPFMVPALFPTASSQHHDDVVHGRTFHAHHAHVHAAA